MYQIKMKHSQAREIARKALGIAIAKNRGQVIALLKKYGVAVDNSYSDEELIVGTLTALQSNSRFRDDLKKLLAKSATESISSFTGESGMEFFNYEGEGTTEIVPQTAGNTTTTSTTAPTVKQKTAIGSLLSNKDTLNSILGTGLNVLSTSLTNKSNQKLANTALAIETEKTKQAALAASGTGSGGGGQTPKSGMSTGLKVGIGVGITALIAVIVYALWPKNSKPKKVPQS